MTQGKGSLAKLEQLKANHADEIRAAALKRRKRGPLCLHFRCEKADLVESPGGLRLRGGWCKLKRCPRKQLEEYLRLLDQTRHWRQEGDVWTAAFWWGTVERKRGQLREALRCGA